MYYSNARKTAKISAVLAYCICRKRKQKKERGKTLKKEIQNQPPYSGGV